MTPISFKITSIKSLSSLSGAKQLLYSKVREHVSSDQFVGTHIA